MGKVILKILARTLIRFVQPAEMHSCPRVFALETGRLGSILSRVKPGLRTRSNFIRIQVRVQPILASSSSSSLI